MQQTTLLTGLGIDIGVLWDYGLILPRWRSQPSMSYVAEGKLPNLSVPWFLHY